MAEYALLGLGTAKAANRGYNVFKHQTPESIISRGEGYLDDVTKEPFKSAALGAPWAVAEKQEMRDRIEG